jgi:hypothetical protein
MTRKRLMTTIFATLVLLICSTVSYGQSRMRSIPTRTADSTVILQGSTNVEFSETFQSAMESLDLSVAFSQFSTRGTYVQALGGSVFDSFPPIQLPITTGAFDYVNLRFEFQHSGGIAIRSTPTQPSPPALTVNLIHFNIDGLGDEAVLTGVVMVNDSIVGRLPLFRLTPTEAPLLPCRPTPAPASSCQIASIFLRIPNVQMTLTQEAADALNSVLQTGAFAEGIDIGTASIVAYPTRLPASY